MYLLVLNSARCYVNNNTCNNDTTLRMLCWHWGILCILYVMNLTFTDIMHLLYTQYVDNATYKIGIHGIVLHYPVYTFPVLCTWIILSAQHKTNTRIYDMCMLVTSNAFGSSNSYCVGYRHVLSYTCTILMVNLYLSVCCKRSHVTCVWSFHVSGCFI